MDTEALKGAIVENAAEVKRLRQNLASMIAIAMIVAGCATDSGIRVCRAKNEKEQAAEKRANAHESLAESYRITHDEDLARYHQAQAQQERSRAEGESDFWADMMFAIFGNCDR